MSEFAALVDDYIRMWNETDPARRRALIERTWSEGATYIDPVLEAEGAAAIDRMVESVHARFPGHRFRLAGPVDGHHGRIRFAWELAPESGAPVVRGIDIGVIAADRRLAAVTGFFDHVAAA